MTAQMQDYKSLAADTVAELKKQGADACDVVIAASSDFDVTVRLGEIEKLEQSISKGMGLRIFKNGAMAMTYTTDFSDKSVHSLVRDAMDIVKVSSADSYNGLAPKNLLGIYDGSLSLYDSEMASLSPETKIELAKAVEAAGRAYDARITNSEGAAFANTEGQFTLANSDGFVGEYRATAASLSVSLLAEENGVKQMDFWYSFNRFADKLDNPKAVGEEAARRTLRKLGAKKVKSQVVPVVIDPMVSRRLVGMVFGAASGRGIYRKSSFLVDEIGEQIASPLVSIMDDATLADGPASRPFDGEGVKSSRISLVENGVLKNYVCDSYAARRLNLVPTGNASRGYASAPSIGSTNLFMKAGMSDPKDIIKSVKNGFYLTQLMGHGYNAVTGDLSQGAAGFWIENGELTFAVQEITIAGNLLTMLNNITMVGNDLSFRFGGTAAPTLLISEATIGGT
jgi:PmbA protein